MAPWIHSFIPSGIETYVEVFGGAFWVYMKSDVDNPLAKQHIYNDFNPYMVNLYRCASNPKQLSKFIDSKNVPLQSGENKSPLDECRKFFYQCKDDMFASTFAITTLRKILEDKSIVKKERKALNETLDFARKRRTEVNGQISEKFGEKIKAGRKDQMAAMQYVFLLTNCFSGAAADEGNVRRFKNITACENMSFEEVIAKYDSPTTYFYCDPPYWNTEDYYSLHGFGREEHFQLMDCLHNMKGKFSLSYYDFDGLNDMYPKDQYKWETKEFVKASGARDGEAQSIGEEVLIMNYQP